MESHRTAIFIAAILNFVNAQVLYSEPTISNRRSPPYVQRDPDSNKNVLDNFKPQIPNHPKQFGYSGSIFPLNHQNQDVYELQWQSNLDGIENGLPQFLNRRSPVEGSYGPKLGALDQINTKIWNNRFAYSARTFPLNYQNQEDLSSNDELPSDSYRRSPFVESNSGPKLGVLGQFNQKFWNNQRGFGYSGNNFALNDQNPEDSDLSSNDKLPLDTYRRSPFDDSSSDPKLSILDQFNQKFWNNQGFGYNSKNVELNNQNLTDDSDFELPPISYRRNPFTDSSSGPKLGVLDQFNQKFWNYPKGYSAALYNQNLEDDIKKLKENKFNRVSSNSNRIRNNEQTRWLPEGIRKTYEIKPNLPQARLQHSNMNKLLPEANFPGISQDLNNNFADSNDLKPTPSLLPFGNPNLYLGNRQYNMPLKIDSQDFNKGLPVEHLLRTMPYVRDPLTRKLMDKDDFDLNEYIVTQYIVQHFTPERVRMLINSAKTEEEREQLVMALANYKMITHSLLDFIGHSDPLAGYIKKIMLITENKKPGSGVSISTLEEVFDDDKSDEKDPGDVIKNGIVIHDHQLEVKPNVDVNIGRDPKNNLPINIISFDNDDSDELVAEHDARREPLKNIDLVNIENQIQKPEKIKVLNKEELEEFKKDIQIHDKIDKAFCEKLNTKEAISVMESILTDFIEDLSYRFDKDVVLSTAKYSVERNLKTGRDQDCFYY